MRRKRLKAIRALALVKSRSIIQRAKKAYLRGRQMQGAQKP